MAKPTRLREAHAHIAAFGRERSFVQLANAASREDALARVAQAAEALPKDAWVIAVGLRPDGWADPRWPSAGELDRAALHRPCVVWSFDHHALACNAAAMERAGLTHASPDPEGGRIVRDASGAPSGLMLEAAAKHVWAAVPEPDERQRREHVATALRLLRGMGFVEVHDMLAQDWLGPVLAEMSDAGELPCTVWLYAPEDRIVDFDRAADDWQREDVWLAGGKIFADGTLNARTAWVLEPYADGHAAFPCGEALRDADAIRAALLRCRDLGLGLAVHAIGDGAVRAALDAYESVDRTNIESGELGIPELRIEHCELIDAADVPRFAELGVVASVQPCHLLTDIEALRRGQPGRLSRVLPLRELADAGCRPGDLLWFGSDVPIVPPDPADSILAATRRRRVEMPEADAIGWAQRLGESEAWRAFAPRDV